MNLRLFKQSDLENIIALFTDSIHSLTSQHYDAVQQAAWAPQPPDLSEWQVRMSILTTLVAEVDNRLAGFLSFEWNGHIDLLYISPHIARQGIASVLYHEAEHQLITNGATELFTEASLVAAPFFAKHGFQIIEEQHVDRRGVTFRRYAMRKHLPELK